MRCYRQLCYCSQLGPIPKRSVRVGIVNARPYLHALLSYPHWPVNTTPCPGTLTASSYLLLRCWWNEEFLQFTVHAQIWYYPNFRYFLQARFYPRSWYLIFPCLLGLSMQDASVELYQYVTGEGSGSILAPWWCLDWVMHMCRDSICPLTKIIAWDKSFDTIPDKNLKHCFESILQCNEPSVCWVNQSSWLL